MSKTLQIRTAPVGSDWVVIAEWFGAERVVFQGSIFDCCRFVRDHREP